MNDTTDRLEQAATLHRQAEERYREKIAQTPEKIAPCSSKETLQAILELRVYQIELEMQNEELCRTQVELEATRSRYFDLYDLAPVSYFTVSEKGTIEEANLTASTLMGVPRSELTRQPFTRFILKDDQDFHYLRCKQLFATGEPQEYELRMANSDGKTFWGHVTATVAQNDSGATVCRMVVIDITTRKETEERLLELHRALHTILESAPVGVCITIERRLVWVNRKMEELFGYSREELEGQATRMLYPTQTAYEQLGADAYPLLAQGGEYETIQEMVHRDGARFWIHFHAKAIAPANPREGTIWILEDITARYELEQQLRQSEEKYRSLVETISDCIWELDRHGRFTYTNPTFQELLGYRHEELLGKFPADFMLGDAAPRDIMDFETFVAARRSFKSLECRYRHRDGQVIIMEVSGQAVFSPDGEYLGHWGITRNITVGKQAEMLLVSLNNHLEQQVAERTTELTMVNTSLTREIEERSRIGQELLEQQQRLREIVQELAIAEDRERDRIATELHDQVNQRLVLSKMKVEALGRKLLAPALEKSAEGICELLAQTIEDTRSLTAQIRPPLLAGAGLEAAVLWLGDELQEQYGLRLEVCDDHEPKVLEYGLRSFIFQVIRELLINVIKHAGVFRARVEMRREGHYLVIIVADEGSGFDPGAAPSRTARAGGFGLGNVRQKIEYQGGVFQVDSRPGAGARVTIRMPLTAAETSGDAPKKLKLLLVDDQSFVREGLRALMEGEPDLEVVAEARDGRAAVAAARDQRPDVVIMDINMSDMNGIDATRAITTELDGVRVVAFSVETDRHFIIEALKAGASGYVTKDSPFTILAAAIRAVAVGETYLGPRISDIIIRDYLQRVPDIESLGDETLLVREREVLQLLAAGKSAKEIAFALKLSVKTIDGIRNTIMNKLDLHSTAELVKYAIRKGLTSLK